MSQLVDTSKNTSATLKCEALAWCVSHLVDTSKNASATLKCCYALHIFMWELSSAIISSCVPNSIHKWRQIFHRWRVAAQEDGWLKIKKSGGGGGGAGEGSTHAVFSPCEMHLSTRCTVQLHKCRVTFRSVQLGNASTTYQDSRSYWGSQAVGLLKPITKQGVNENQDTTRLNTPNNWR